jgi:methylthioribose-1-phosphate isomerase
MRLSSDKLSSLHFYKKNGEGDWKSPSHYLQAIEFRDNQLKIIDQTQLPGRICCRTLKNYHEVANAIKTLQIRGAPLIGVAAAFGLALEAKNCVKQPADCLRKLTKVAKILKQTRPTAVNLSWAIERIERIIRLNLPPEQMSQAVITEAQKIYQEEVERSFAMGRIGTKLIKKNSCILTICNAGKLAAPGLGTALSVVYTAATMKKNPLVYVCETRPLLQGARLTAFELIQAGINTVLITDNMVGSVASQVDLILVGADRIAANGDTANKIGTLTLAITARHFKIPFYVVAPVSTFDLTKPNGKAIPIEIRDSNEVTTIRSQRIAPKGVMVYNPAFDITPGKLITGIITDKGIVYPPYHKSIQSLLH